MDSADESPDLIVLHTGRMRGNVYPLSAQHLAPLQHYQYIAGYVDRVREEAEASGAEVLLVDLGDSLGGSFASYATDGGNMVEFFNRLEYDAVFLGNLDNNVTPELLERIDAVKLVPFQAPDGRPATSGAEFAARVAAEETPVFLVANFYGDVRPEEYPDRFPTSFGGTPGAVRPLRDYAAALDALGERPPDGVTLLGWMKFESPGKPPEAFLESLTAVGVDAILAHRIYSGGQTDAWAESGFYDWRPPVSENILRNNGGFAMARMDLKRGDGRWRVFRHELLPMTANTAEADPGIVEAIEGFSGRLEAADRVLLELEEAVGEEEILRLYMKALREVPGTDVVVYSPEAIRAPWPGGELSASRVFNSLPWTTEVVQLRLTPAELDVIRERNPRLCILEKTETADGTGASDGTLTLTTSRYFASIFLPQLGRQSSDMLPPDVRWSFVPVEFDWFLGYLDESPNPLDASPGDGWRFEFTENQAP